MLPINFHNIRLVGTSQQDAFEELVCQLARREDIPGGKQFIRKGRPDAGVECIWQLPRNVEWGWQAKYYTKSLDTAQWRELDKSVKTALAKHSNLKRYYVAIPVDRPDAKLPGKKSMLEKWDEYVVKWKAHAKTKGMNVQFIFWGHSELVQALSKKENEGLLYFWFNHTEFTDQWFKDNIDFATNILLNKRYTPALNFELDIAKVFDGLTRSGRFIAQLNLHIEKTFENYLRANHYFENSKTKKEIKQIIKKTAELKTLYYSFDFKRIKNIDFDGMEELVKQILGHCSNQIQILHKLQREKVSADPEKYRLSVEPHSGEIADVRKYSNALEELIDFLQTITCYLVNHPYLMVTGKAGMGKSHLLADIINNRLANGDLSIFLLGHNFNSDDQPWSQILDKQLRISINQNVFLGALNAKAESTGKRIIIFIDAINEGNGKNIWPDHLQNFITLIKRYEWLGLVISIRTSYEKLIAPESLITDDEMPRLVHQGFSGKEYEATRRFFKTYDIEQPPMPMLEPEFQNPLFLKLLCEGLHNNNIKQIPEGFWGISKVFDFFISSINNKLSMPAVFDYSSDINVVDKAVKAILEWKIDKNKRYIPYDDAHVIVQEVFRKYCTKGSNYLDVLVSEGLFNEDLFFDALSGKHDKGIFLAYERFEDNLQASALIDKYVPENDPQKAFESGYLFELTKDEHHCYMNQGLLEALAIQLPERRGKELYELAPRAEKYYPFVDAFVESIPWRKSETLTDKLLDYINNCVLRFNGTKSRFWETLIAVSFRPNHFFNADFLHSQLIRMQLGDRDATWTIYIHNLNDYPTPIKRIIDWHWSEEDKSFISKDVTRLTSIAIGWFFTSCNRTLRDGATKALVSLWENNLDVITSVLEEFKDCNDPYVLDRLYAAAYGAVLRSTDCTGLKELCHFIFSEVFNKKEVYPHILLRDYARGVIEYGNCKGLDLKIDMMKVRPPYKSSYPKKFPSNTEIEKKYLVKYGSKKFKNYHGGQDAILSSMATEYGRKSIGYGDFGRYTFQRGLDDFKVNPNNWSNWAVDRIFKMGYNGKKHGDFDSNDTYHRNRNSRGERIGKKYQWIVFYETLARVSDNFPMIDGSHGEEAKSVNYDGPWSPYVRDIDPTILIKKTKAEKYSAKHFHWWFTEQYSPWQMDNKNWMNLKSDFPDVYNLIQVRHEKQDDWIALEMHLEWGEPKILGEDIWNAATKRLWYQLSSYLVKKEDLGKFTKWGMNKNFFGGHFPKPGNRYEVFYREYYWSNAYRFFQVPYYEGDEFRTFYDHKLNKSIGKVQLTTNYYHWEEEFDSSKEEPINILKPSELLWTTLGMKHGEKEGEYFDVQNNLICFDPSVSNNSQSCLVIRKDSLLKFLKDNNLAIFWTVLGEKQILGDRTLRGYKENAVSGFYWLDNKNKLLGKFLPGISRRG